LSKRKAGDPTAGPRYVQLEEPVLRSLAWRWLSSDAVWLYVEFKRRWPGSEFGIRTLPYDHVSWQLSWYRFDKARAELIEFGFIDALPGGGLEKARKKYRLSNRWKTLKLGDRPWREIQHLEPPAHKGDKYSTGAVPVKPGQKRYNSPRPGCQANLRQTRKAKSQAARPKTKTGRMNVETRT